MVEVKPPAKGGRTPSNPELWRALMTEGVIDRSSNDVFVFRSRRLTMPSYSSDRLASVLDANTGDVFYVGPGRYEVFPPTRAAGGVEVVKQLKAWANVHGWHDLPYRLLEQGVTDYSQYAAIDKEMQPAGSGDSNVFVYRGRTLRLFGPSRWDPVKLQDVDSGEVVWDREASTRHRFPWARQALEIKMSGDSTHVLVRDKESQKLLVTLELACARELSHNTHNTRSQREREREREKDPKEKVRDLSHNTLNTHNTSNTHAIHTTELACSRDQPTSPPANPLPPNTALPASTTSTSASTCTTPHPQSTDAPPAMDPLDVGGDKTKTNAALIGAELPDSKAQPTAGGGVVTLLDGGVSASCATKSKAADVSGLVDAIGKLKEWTERKGWFEVELRLFKAGVTDYKAYGVMEQRMLPVAGRDGFYTLDGRTVEVRGHRLDPLQVVDAENKQVLWDAEEYTSYDHAWASRFFSLRTLRPSGAIQVVERQSGAVVVDVGTKSTTGTNSTSVGANSEDSSTTDPLVLQSILIDAQPVMHRPGLEALLEAGNRVVQVLKSFTPAKEGTAESAKRGGGGVTLSGGGTQQLSIKTGDLLLVSHTGAKGWQLGRLIDPSHPTPLAAEGKEGWFPCTYAAPVQELATWRGRVIQIGTPDEADGVVTVTDATTGAVIFWGHPEAPHEEWNLSNASVCAALKKSKNTEEWTTSLHLRGAHVPKEAEPPPSDLDPTCKTSPRTTAAELGSPRGSPRDNSPRKPPLAPAGSPSGSPSGGPISGVAGVAGELGAAPRGVPGPRQMKTETRVCAAVGGRVPHLRLQHMQSVDLTGRAAAWLSNTQLFVQCVSSHVFLDGQFASSSPTLALEETLEVRATGTFRYIAWCRGGMLLSLGQGQQQEGAVCDGRWMVLGGLYKVLVNGDEGATLVLSLQTASEAATRPGALLAPVKVIEGVAIRGRMIQEHGRFQGIEWDSGHSEMGISGIPLRVVTVTVC